MHLGQHHRLRPIEKVEGSRQRQDRDRHASRPARPYPDWQSLFGALFPSHVAAQQGDLNTPGRPERGLRLRSRAPRPGPAGPYKITKYEQGRLGRRSCRTRSGTGTKAAARARSPSGSSTTRPSTLPALRNKEVQVLNSQPNADLVQQVQRPAGRELQPVAGHELGALRPQPEEPVPGRHGAAPGDLHGDQPPGDHRQDGRPVLQEAAAAQQPQLHARVARATRTSSRRPARAPATSTTAKKILTDAGYKIEGGKLIGKNGQPVPPLRFRYTTGNRCASRPASCSQAQLKQIGVDDQDRADRPASATRCRHGDYDMIIFAWVGSPFIAGNKRPLAAPAAASNYGKYRTPRSTSCSTRRRRSSTRRRRATCSTRPTRSWPRTPYVLPLFQKPTFIAVYNEYRQHPEQPDSYDQTVQHPGVGPEGRLTLASNTSHLVSLYRC